MFLFSAITSKMMSLNNLIHETIASAKDGVSRADTLLALLRKNHFWPALQMKKFFDKSGLVLLHNTYKRVDVDHFKELYDECRSVVLDLDAPEGSNIVLSLAHSIPERLTIPQYSTLMQDTDVCELAYEGTVVSVYHHAGTWHMGTTSCPSVDASRYFHPTKTHGQMVDEVLAKMFPEVPADTVRNEFSSKLDPRKSYAFVLVHHENKHVMDYTTQFGESYGELIHISTRDRETLTEESLDDKPLSEIGIKYAVKYDSPSEAIGVTGVYGLVVKTQNGKMYKVSSDDILKREERDLGNPNKWINMLSVYMQTKPDYHINDYIREFAPDLQNPTNESGRELAPTYLIHTVICTMRDILYNWYVRTTAYNPTLVRFRMNKDVDAMLPPMMRFHLAQLRNLQVKDHVHAFLTPRAVYHYLCHHQTMKNIRGLINFMATTPGHNMTYNQAECFAILNQLLSE